LRVFAAALAACALAISTGALAAQPPEHVIGEARAPVTVTEYASVGCPHCATWANDVFPAFKKAYLDTGKARFAFHEMLTGDVELAVAGFLVADCAPPDRYFQVIDSIFADQLAIAQGGAPALMKVAQGAGLTAAQFQACLTNEAALKELQDRTQADAQGHGVDSTPTFLIGDQKLVGELTLEQLSAAIEKARRARPGG
jgi:protein-disulfide isomerase